MIENIRKNAELVRSLARDQMAVSIDFDRAAVEWLDGYVTRRHERDGPDQAAALVDTLGSFFGECIVRTYGGEWFQNEYGWGVRFDNMNVAYPFAKMEKHLRNGPDDSVLGMFDTIAVLFDLDI